MINTDESPAGADLVDRVVGLAEGDALHATRHARAKVAVATQKSYETFFSPELGDLTLRDRLLVAYYACLLSRADGLGRHYRQALLEQGDTVSMLEAVEAGRLDRLESGRLGAMLKFTQALIEKPIEGDQAALQALQAAGIATPDIVTLAQLVAFLSYQLRLTAGLQAMKALEKSA